MVTGFIDATLKIGLLYARTTSLRLTPNQFYLVHTIYTIYTPLPLTAAGLQHSPLASFDPLSKLDGTSMAGLPVKKSDGVMCTCSISTGLNRVKLAAAYTQK